MCWKELLVKDQEGKYSEIFRNLQNKRGTEYRKFQNCILTKKKLSL